MKILRRDRSGDLKQANSPYRTERAAYWTWTFLRHPISMTFQRYAQVTLTADAWTSVLPVYGNFEIRASSGVQVPGAQIDGDADSLRRLAALLIDRAHRVEIVQALLDDGVWPDSNAREAFPAGFENEVEWQDERLGNAPFAGRGKATS